MFFLTSLIESLQMDKSTIVSKGMEKRVREEISIHSKLKHPAIIELYKYFEDSENVYLVLELAHNGELHRYMRESQRVMSEAETANILAQVVSGLLYLKVNNIVHRDMSLSNLLLTKDFKVKISDFGLATELKRPDEKHMTLCGTPNYISPEVASRASHGLPVDVWGLGCMMYTLLVGKPPFDTDGIKSTLTRVVMNEIKMPPNLTIEAKDLLGRLLCKNPLERIHVEDILTHSFMTKYLSAQYINLKTIASLDSGLMTMSSNAISSAQHYGSNQANYGVSTEKFLRHDFDERTKQHMNVLAETNANALHNRFNNLVVASDSNEIQRNFNRENYQQKVISFIIIICYRRAM